MGNTLSGFYQETRELTLKCWKRLVHCRYDREFGMGVIGTVISQEVG